MSFIPFYLKCHICGDVYETMETHVCDLDTEDPEKPSKPASKPSESTPKPASKPSESTPKPASKQSESTPKPASKPSESTPKPASKPSESTPKPASKPSESTPKPASKPSESIPKPASKQSESRPNNPNKKIPISFIISKIITSLHNAQKRSQDETLNYIKQHIQEDSNGKKHLVSDIINTPSGKITIPKLALTNIPNLIVSEAEINLNLHLYEIDTSDGEIHGYTTHVKETQNETVNVTLKLKRDSHPNGIVKILEDLEYNQKTQ